MVTVGNNLRPVRRSRLRQALGRWAYGARRCLWWAFGGCRFARTRARTPLEHLCMAHSTPLLRQLKGADMALQRNKVVNLRIAAERLDGLLLRPGQVFSFWRLVGRPSATRGFLPGMTLHCGTVGAGVGGGLCQMTNLIYWMTLHTELTVLERHRHSYDVFPDSNRMLPFGSGATCAWPHLDLMIRNDTMNTYQLRVRVGEHDLEGQWRCDDQPACRYEVVERDARMCSEPWGGFSRHNTLIRRRLDTDGALRGEELVTENHALMMYAPFLTEGTLEQATVGQVDRQ